MNFFFTWLLSAILFLASSCCAQAYSGRYDIGTSDYPVTVAEYCFFLNQNEGATEGGFLSSYAKIFYDHHLMTGSDAVIIRSAEMIWFASSYHYTVRPGCEDQIIEFLESADAQLSFSSWRSVPSVGEFCNYINDQIIFCQGSSRSMMTIELATEEEHKIRELYRHSRGITQEFNKICHAVDKIITDPSHEQAFFESNFYYYNGGGVGVEEGPLITGFAKGQKLLTVSPEGPSQELVAHMVDGVNKYDRPWNGLWFDE